MEEVVFYGSGGKQVKKLSFKVERASYHSKEIREKEREREFTVLYPEWKVPLLNGIGNFNFFQIQRRTDETHTARACTLIS